MTSEDNKKVIRDFFGTDDFSKAEELLHEDYSYRSTVGEEVHGRDAAIDFLKMYFEAFSDLEIKPENIIAEGDTVYFEYRQQGTHTGEFWGIKPTNKKTDIRITARMKFKDGKMYEQFDNYNGLELLRQLDALPKEATQKVEQYTSQMSRSSGSRTQ